MLEFSSPPSNWYNAAATIRLYAAVPTLRPTPSTRELLHLYGQSRSIIAADASKVQDQDAILRKQKAHLLNATPEYHGKIRGSLGEAYWLSWKDRTFKFCFNITVLVQRCTLMDSNSIDLFLITS